jgi:hypothetical protein
MLRTSGSSSPPSCSRPSLVSMWTTPPSLAAPGVAGIAPVVVDGVPITAPAAAVLDAAGAGVDTVAFVVGFGSADGAPPDSALRSSCSILRTCCRISSISCHRARVNCLGRRRRWKVFTRSSSSWAVEEFVGMAVVDAMSTLFWGFWEFGCWVYG